MTTDIAEQNIHNNSTDIHTDKKKISIYVIVISTELKLSFY